MLTLRQLAFAPLSMSYLCRAAQSNIRVELTSEPLRHVLRLPLRLALRLASLKNLAII